ncbi:hypothetical protein BHYA_0498g00010 [Botrytis hyacinthi]|uniref:Uncharacterized protein n=1 Tax=Botrytis hyacinthi TaxID=278943 RepID=A0A4Z1GBS8_9HELO|nr:hypothetical protein BHYA_0498g00010 [Botrytis hyacinthi]
MLFIEYKPARLIYTKAFEIEKNLFKDLDEIINNQYFENRLKDTDAFRNAFQLAAMHLASQDVLYKNDEENSDINNKEENDY